MEQDRRGILYPARLPEFHRIAPPQRLAHAVRWFWIPEWDLPEGEVSRQEVLPFPACNLVVEESGPSAVGPSTRRSERVLEGRGWAVGALLRPAAAPALIAELDPAFAPGFESQTGPRGGAPHRARDGAEGRSARPGRRGVSLLRDAAAPIAAPELHAEVVAAMSDRSEPGDARRARAVSACSDWLLERVPEPARGSEGALANALEEALADPGITRTDQLPPRLHVSARTLQRLAERCFGVSLHAMIRRRRLQEAAERIREDPCLRLASLAGQLGYADHAHFTSDFRALLGVTPSEYRTHSGG